MAKSTARDAARVGSVVRGGTPLRAASLCSAPRSA